MADINPRALDVQAYAVLDALAELHCARVAVDPELSGPSGKTVSETIAALVELIEADHEYDAARINYREVAARSGAVADKAACAAAFNREVRAIARRAAALRCVTIRAPRTR